MECTKIASITGLSMLILRKACLQGWLFAGLGTDLGRVSTYHLIRIFTVPKPFMQTIWFMPNTCFPSGSLEFWQMLGTGCLHGYSPIISLDAEILMSFLSRQRFTRVVTICCWGNKRVLCAYTGKGLWKLVTVPRASPQVPFSFADHALHPSDAVHHSHEYNTRSREST